MKKFTWILAILAGLLLAHADPAPLITTDAELARLLEYQLFGADYLQAEHDFILGDSRGYIGSNHELRSIGGNWSIKPTVLIGGDGTGSANLVNGGDVFYAPFIVEGGLSGMNGATFNDTLAVQSNPVNIMVMGTGLRLYSLNLWPTALRNRIMDIDIPTLGTCVSDLPGYTSATNIDVNVGNLQAPNYRVLDVTGLPLQVVTICVGNVVGNPNGFKLLVRQTPTQLVRLIITGTLSVSHNFHLGPTLDGLNLITKDAYIGNLMVFVNGKWTVTGNNMSMVASIIHPGKVTFEHGTNLVGQIAADTLSMIGGFNAQLFKYVPIDVTPGIPEVVPVIALNGNTPLSESNTAIRTLTVRVAAPTTVPISMRYSFKWGTATAQDFNPPPTGGTLTIPAGSTTATFPLAVYNDALIEGTEKFSIYLNQLSGADFPMGRADMTFPMTIRYND